ncbi:MAG: DUF255 domain-containing protein [Chloroflexi bacterium]|nr:DUF255 domain-containing protein [Chloroflexota bacterium]
MVEPTTFRFSPRSNRAHLIRWREWGAAAFDEAARTDKLVALFITAFWCGVCQHLDETALSSDEVQLLLNAYFVPVRVEEARRPDVDLRYTRGLADDRVSHSRRRANPQRQWSGDGGAHWSAGPAGGPTPARGRRLQRAAETAGGGGKSGGITRARVGGPGRRVTHRSGGPHAGRVGRADDLRPERRRLLSLLVHAGLERAAPREAARRSGQFCRRLAGWSPGRPGPWLQRTFTRSIR